MVNLTRPGLLETVIRHWPKMRRGNPGGKERVMWRRTTRHGLWIVWMLLELCPGSEFRYSWSPGFGEWGGVEGAAFN